MVHRILRKESKLGLFYKSADYECTDETAEEVEAENESDVNRRNNPNRSITTEPPSAHNNCA